MWHVTHSNSNGNSNDNKNNNDSNDTKAYKITQQSCAIYLLQGTSVFYGLNTNSTVQYGRV